MCVHVLFFSLYAAKARPYHSGFSSEKYQQVAQDALLQACSLQAAVSVDCKPEDCKSHLETWWNNGGATFIGSGADAAPDSDTDSDEECFEMPIEGEAGPESDAVAARLMRAEDVISCQNEIQALQGGLEGPAATLADVSEPCHATDLAAQVQTAHKPDPVQTAKPAGPRTLAGIMAAAVRSNPGAFGESGKILDRLAALTSVIKQFASQVRINEKILSPAQVDSSKKAGLSEWNQTEHLLAVARAKSTLSGQKKSREAGWIASQERLAERACRDVPKDKKHLSPVTEYRHMNLDDAQVIVYKTAINGASFAIRVGLVVSVFKSAVSHSKVKGVTTARQGRPVSGSWPLSAANVLSIHFEIF